MPEARDARSPAGVLFVPQMIYEYGEPRWNDIERIKSKNTEKGLSQCHLFTINPMRTDPRANTGLRDERWVTNRLSHGTAHLVPYVMSSAEYKL
jgi:hypothetical protein